MNKKDIARRVKSIRNGLITIGFVVESHNANSFFKHFDFGFRHRKGYDVYVTGDETRWTIKAVDLEDERDGRNVLNGCVSFNNERNSVEFFDSLFGHILFKNYMKGRANLRAECQNKLKEIMGVI